MSLVLMIVGARGCGKTKVREIIENFGFISVDTENFYLKYGELYPDKVVSEYPDIQDLIYEEIKDEILDKACLGNVVYESTGTNDRWVDGKDTISKQHFVLVCKVTCEPIVTNGRIKARGWDNNYPCSQEYMRDISRKSDKIVYDFLVENDGTINELHDKVLQVIRKIDYAK